MSNFEQKNMPMSHYERLREKYGISGMMHSQTEIDVILAKLEDRERLTETDAQFLREQGEAAGRLAMMLYGIAADVYEQQYQQNDDFNELRREIELWETLEQSQRVIINGLQSDFNRVQASLKEAKQTISIRCQRLIKQYGIISPTAFEQGFYAILHKLDQGMRLTENDVRWLKQHNGWSSLIQNAYHSAEARHYEDQYRQDHQPDHLINAATHWQANGEAEKAYQATKDMAIDSLSDEHLKTVLMSMRCQRLCQQYGVVCSNASESDLYPILQKLARQTRLTAQEADFLKRHRSWSSLIHSSYHNTEARHYEEQYHRNHNPAMLIQAASHWQDLGDIEKACRLTEKIDLDSLPNEKLKTVLLRIRCVALSNKYHVTCPKGREKEFYSIVQKLDQKTRLTPQEYLWLDEQKLLSETTVRRIYHEIEATWFETQLRQTKKKNYWNAVNASSHWRGAGNSEHALTLTADIPFEQINDKKLKSALLTTRGGALRDLEELNDAEECAIQAMTFNPDAYQPYTLRGAIYYDRGYYNEGDYWFDEAIKRGATPKDVDAELLRIIKRITNKEERQTLINHLLAKDPGRYAWVKKFREDSSNKKAKQQPQSQGKPKSSM